MHDHLALGIDWLRASWPVSVRNDSACGRPRWDRASRNGCRRKQSGGSKAIPSALVAFYGPDNRFASKVAVAIVTGRTRKPLPSSDGTPTPNERAGFELIGTIQAGMSPPLYPMVRTPR